MEDSIIEKKRAQRKALLRGMYGLVDGREGFTITPMQYFAVGVKSVFSRMSQVRPFASLCPQDCWNTSHHRRRLLSLTRE